MRYEIEGKLLSDIGDAIREKTGKSELILPGDMPGEIAGISGSSSQDPEDEISEKYEILEYIESNGTQAIDTGVVPPSNTVIYAIVTFDYTKVWTWPMGCSTNGGFIGYQYVGGSNERINIYNGPSSIYANWDGGFLGHPRGIEFTTVQDALYSLTIFGLNLSDGIQQSSISSNKFYSMRIGDNYFVPARRIEDAQIGVLNTYTGEFLTDVLNGDPFIAGPVVTSRRYCLVNTSLDPFSLTDYIESSGTQYIDTGYIIKDNTRFEIVCNPTIYGSRYPHIFGTRIDYLNNSACLMFGAYGNNNEIQYSWSNIVGSHNYSNGSTSLFRDKKVEIICSKSGASFILKEAGYTGGIINAHKSTPACPYPVHIFAQDSGGVWNYDTAINMKLYRFRIFEGDLMVMELLPAIDTDGVVCLYDTVSGNYYYNPGTGNFTYGRDED